MTRIEEIEKIADWSGIIPLFRKLPVNFTKNYYFVWTLPQGESDGPVTMGMYKFGGYRGENVLLCSSVVEVKEKLFRLLFGKAPVVVSTILKSLLKLPLVEPRWVDDEKLEVFKKGFKLIPVQKQWWYLKFQRGSIDAITRKGC